MARVGWSVLRFDNLFHMGVLWTLAVILSYLKLLFQKVCRSPAVVSFPRSSPENAPVKGLACIVTGDFLADGGSCPSLGDRFLHLLSFAMLGSAPVFCGTCKASSGIGKATAEALALHGYHVILASRSMTSLLEVMTELKKKHGHISLEVLELDLCSVKSILSFKDEVKQSLQNSQPSRELQLLVNNAGILAGSQRWTDHGFDSMIASNYLGPYLLTQQLLPMLHNGSHARVVNVVSFTHRCVTKMKVVEKELAQGSMQTPSWTGNWYKAAQIYETSKRTALLPDSILICKQQKFSAICILLFSYELHRRFSVTADSSKISVLAADPGVVQTNIMRELPAWLEKLALFVLKLMGLLQSPDVGAHAVIDAALAPEGLSGKYFFGGGGRVLKSSSLSYDSDLANQLWEASSSVYSAQHCRDYQ